MKHLSVFILALLLIFAGCRRQVAVLPRLVELDSLLAVAPDSAAALLAAIPADSLINPENRAYHALLTTQANYKAYIPFGEGALDTINMAVRYYSDGHNTEKNTRSNLYKGCVFEDQQQLDSAMYYYKAAEDLATQSGDTYHHGYALMRQAWLYHSQYDFDRAISLYRLALDTFETPKDDKQTIQVLNAIAGLYITINIDSAQLFGEKAMQLSLSSDRYDLDYCSKILADICFVKHDYKPCIEMAEEAITNTKDRQVYFHCHQLLAQAFAYLGSADSSRYYLMTSTPPTDKQDSVMLLTTQSVIAASNQENQKKLELQLLAGNIADTIVSEKSIHQLEQAAHDYQVSKMASQYEIKRTRALVVMLSLLLLLLACSIWIYRVSVRRRMELEHARTQLNAKLAELSKQTGENELQIKTVTLALSTVSYLGKRGASSFKDDKDLITANLPQEFWDDAELLTRKRLSKCLQSMAENGIELKKEEMRVLSLSLCGVPDVVIAKLMDYSSRRTVHNIKAAVAKKLDSSDGSLSDKLTKLINEA